MQWARLRLLLASSRGEASFIGRRDRPQVAATRLGRGDSIGGSPRRRGRHDLEAVTATYDASPRLQPGRADVAVATTGLGSWRPAPVAVTAPKVAVRWGSA